MYSFGILVTALVFGPAFFSQEEAVFLFLVVALIIGVTQARRLRPSVSTATSIPREEIKQVYYSSGSRFRPPRFVIEFERNGKTKLRLIEFQQLIVDDKLATALSVFEEIGFEPQESPPPIGIMAYIISKMKKTTTMI